MTNRSVAGVLLSLGMTMSLACDETALGSLSQALPWQPPEAEVIVSFTLDDGFDSQLLAAQILQGDVETAPEDSYRGTFFIVTGALRRPTDGAGRMTPAEVQALHAAGHEIGGHTLGHLDLAALALVDPYEVRRQICNDRRALEALGVQPVGFAYPKSADNGVHEVAQACGYAYARDADGLTLPPRAGLHAETVPPLAPFDIAALPSISAAAPVGDVRREASTAAGLQAWVEAVRAGGGGWVNLILHHVRESCGTLDYCMEEAELRGFVAWLRTRPHGVAVRTMAQVVLGDALVGNPSLETPNTGASPPRPLCWKRVGNGSNFPAIVAPGPGRTGSYAEILRPTTSVATPAFEIDRLGRGCALPVTPGRRYELRAFARCVSPPGVGGRASGRLTMTVLVDGVWQPTVLGPVVATTDDWTPLSFLSPPLPPGATAVVFGVQYAGGTGTRPDLHVDDFSIIER
jgi:peptidoglycan/xylan/chitin deacetylase (PgdA/CDA1 family)